MLKPLKPMVQLFYEVNAAIMIDDNTDFYERVKKYFDKHWDGEY